MLTSEEIENLLGTHRIVPVVLLEDDAHAPPLGKALIDGGLPVAEVTFRTAAAEASIRKMSELDGLLVGAGTVLSAEQVDAAVDAGAQFIVSPGFNPKVVERCQEVGVSIIPGVATPTEIEMALAYGLKTMKFFPAEASGGVAMLKAISAPYSGLKFMPTGGISKTNLPDYLALDCVLACGGSWLVSPKLFADGDFSSVEAAVKEAAGIVSSMGS